MECCYEGMLVVERDIGSDLYDKLNHGHSVLIMLVLAKELAPANYHSAGK